MADFLGFGAWGGRVPLHSITCTFYSTSLQWCCKLYYFSFSMTTREPVLFACIPIILLVVIQICSRKMTLAVEKHIFRNVLLALQSVFLSHFIISIFPLKMVISLYFFPNKSIFSSRSFFAALLSTSLEQQSWMEKVYCVQQEGIWNSSCFDSNYFR